MLIITDKLLCITQLTTDLIRSLVQLLQHNYEYKMLTFFTHYRSCSIVVMYLNNCVKVYNITFDVYYYNLLTFVFVYYYF